MLIILFSSLLRSLKFLNLLFDKRISFFIDPIDQSISDWVVNCSSRQLKFTTKSISNFLSAYFLLLYVSIIFFCLIFDNGNETLEMLIYEFTFIFGVTFLGFKTKDEFIELNKSFFNWCTKRMLPVMLFLNLLVTTLCLIVNLEMSSLGQYGIVNLIAMPNLLLFLVLGVVYVFLILLPYFISLIFSYLTNIFFIYAQKKSATPRQTFYGFLSILGSVWGILKFG